MSFQKRDGATVRCNSASILLGTVAAAALLAAGQPAAADEHMVMVDQIVVPPGDVPPPACVPGTGLGTFDISFVDPKTELYVLADRTNAAVDFFDASDNTFIGRVGGFAGVVCSSATAANNALSGPDGVVIVGGQVWAGDGDSTLKVIDIVTFKITDTVTVTDPTEPSVKKRVDEMAWDASDHILAAANNANVPPFVTLINTDTHQILGQIVFDGKGTTPDATQTGIEQPQWSPQTGLFYVSVPQIDPTNAAQGGVSVIDPHSMTVITTYPVTNCSPAGLALGPKSSGDHRVRRLIWNSPHHSDDHHQSRQWRHPGKHPGGRERRSLVRPCYAALLSFRTRHFGRQRQGDADSRHRRRQDVHVRWEQRDVNHSALTGGRQGFASPLCAHRLRTN